jgi:hypothetical protein
MLNLAKKLEEAFVVCTSSCLLTGGQRREDRITVWLVVSPLAASATAISVLPVPRFHVEALIKRNYYRYQKMGAPK